MAMNKSEKVKMAELKIELGKARSLSWPQYQKPEMLNPKEICTQFGDLVKGWFYWANSYAMGGSFRVSYGCSNGVSHSRDNSERTISQGGGQIYGKKSEALKAARIDLTNYYALELAKLDRAIQEAEIEEAKDNKNLQQTPTSAE